MAAVSKSGNKRKHSSNQLHPPGMNFTIQEPFLRHRPPSCIEKAAVKKETIQLHCATISTFRLSCVRSNFRPKVWQILLPPFHAIGPRTSHEKRFKKPIIFHKITRLSALLITQFRNRSRPTFYRIAFVGSPSSRLHSLLSRSLCRGLVLIATFQPRALM